MTFAEALKDRADLRRYLSAVLKRDLTDAEAWGLRNPLLPFWSPPMAINQIVRNSVNASIANVPMRSESPNCR